MPELPQSRVRSGRRRRPRALDGDHALGAERRDLAPSWRSTRAVLRASSEVSAPPTWLVPRASAANSSARWVMLLSPGTRTGPRTIIGRVPRGILCGRQVGAEPVGVAGGEQRPKLGERYARSASSASASAADLSAECRATCRGCSRPAGWCPGRPVPNDTPASPRSASALASAEATACGRWLVQASWRSCAAGVDQDRLRPRAPRCQNPITRAGRPGRRRRAGLAHVDHAAAQAVGPGRGESRIVGSRERMAAGEPVAQPRGRGPGHRPAL